MSPQKWGGLPKKDTVTVAHITDCPTITFHAGNCYKALIDSGSAISLLRYSTYKKIEDCYKTPIQPTTAKVNAANGSPMSAIGTTALHLRIAEFKFTHIFIICDQLALIFKENSHYLMHGAKKVNCYIQREGKF